MPSFKFEYRESGGRLAAGTIQAASVAEAAGQLRSQGLFLLSISPLAAAGKGLMGSLRSVSIEMGPGLKDVLSFTNQLAVMIKAGISIREAIDGIGRQVKNPKFRRMIAQIKADVEGGQPFSAALARYPKTFSPLYVNMVRASELSGSFGQMLDRIAAYLAQQVETRGMVRGAMVYPSIIATMAISVTIFLLTWVLPKFTVLFIGKEDLLPKPTVFLLAISSFLQHYWHATIGGVFLALGGFLYAIRTPRGKAWWDLVKLRIPLFKRMFRALYITRGMHTMAELVSAGVPMLETLAITADVSGNALYRRMWMFVHQSVKQGQKIAQPLARQNLLPGNVVQMISAGEESGRLGEVMRDIAEYYAKELRSTIKAVTAMIEPLMIVLMGVIVGFIAMSIILPIFKMSSLVK
jgi:type IV pilus assembly protein PilC